MTSQSGSARSPWQPLGLLTTVKPPALRGRHNYVYSGESNIDEGVKRLQKVAPELESNFTRYKIVRFCNLARALELLKASLEADSYLPCRLTVYVPQGSQDVFIVVMRPTLLGKLLRNDGVARATRGLEEDILKILETLKDL